MVDTSGHLNGSRAIAELAAVVKGVLPKGCYSVSKSSEA